MDTYNFQCHGELNEPAGVDTSTAQQRLSLIGGLAHFYTPPPTPRKMPHRRRVNSSPPSVLIFIMMVYGFVICRHGQHSVPSLPMSAKMVLGFLHRCRVSQSPWSIG